MFCAYTMPRYLVSVYTGFGLSSVWNRYAKGKHTTWVTRYSIMVYDEIEYRICKEFDVSKCNFVY